MSGRRSAAVCVLVVLLTAGIPAGAQDHQRLAEQTRIETGEDLAPRAQQVLFRARTRQESGEHGQAVRILDDWLTGGPDRDHHLLRFTRAVSRQALDDEPGALADLRTAVALEPRFARAWLRLGEAAHTLESYAEAAEAFAAGYELMPDPNPEILYYAATCRLLAGDPDRAGRTLQDLLVGHRSAATLSWYQVLVAAAVGGSDPEAGRPWLEDMLTDFAGDAGAWGLYAQYAATLQDYRAAAVCLTVAGYLRPLTAAQLRQLGDLYAAIDVPLMAARCYQQALQLETGAATGERRDPGDQYEQLAAAWLAAHDLDAARAALLSGLEVRPEARLWALLGDVDLTAEDPAAALAHFRQAVALDDRYGRGYLMMGYCALELEQDEQARTHLERAAEFSEHAAAARDLLRRIPR